MSTYLKNTAAFVALFLFAGCVNSLGHTQKDEAAERKELCYKASYGDLSVSQIDTSNQEENAFLLNCAVSVIVPMLNESKKIALERNSKKVNLANSLLALELDVNYVDETNTSLLMSIVISYMPQPWKLKTTQYLLEHGAKLNFVNEYGKSALDLAKFRQETELVKLLSNYSKKEKLK